MCKQQNNTSLGYFLYILLNKLIFLGMLNLEGPPLLSSFWRWWNGQWLYLVSVKGHAWRRTKFLSMYLYILSSLLLKIMQKIVDNRTRTWHIAWIPRHQHAHHKISKICLIICWKLWKNFSTNKEIALCCQQLMLPFLIAEKLLFSVISPTF